MSRGRLCVFCGSSLSDPAYRAAAARLGTLIGEGDWELIYGGGRIGLMGILADAAIAAGARVTGVIPTALHGREVGHPRLSELILVPDMQERKREMFARSDAVAILPGGLGTLDEAFEAITLKQLGFFEKPVVILDTEGFWQPLTALIEHVIGAGFARPDARDLYRIVSRPEDVLPACADAAARG